jgi:polyhydroxyalkanoate synthase
MVQGACAGDRAQLQNVLAGLKKYQAAPLAPPRQPLPPVAVVGSVTLRDCGGVGAPLVLVPSLINPAHVLDLAPGNSLIAHLRTAGWRPLLVDWGPVPEPLGLAALVAERLAPLISAAATDGPVPVLGYCLGGSLAAAAARIAPVSALALLAAPWRFGGYDAAAQAALAGWWAAAAPLVARLGALPMDVLQPAFWSLDPPGLAAK